MIIRHATLDDLPAIVEAEALSFPSAEACGEDSFRRRLTAYPDHFWLLVDDDGNLLSFVNGLVTDERDLRDEMYDDADMHDEGGAWQMIFGVVTVPQARRQGHAGTLLARVVDDARKQGRKGLVLTCKEPLIHYYAKFGFVDEGISGSEHGGVAWHQMRVEF